MYSVIVVAYVFGWILQDKLVLTAPQCRCLSNNPTCWPNATVWQTFSQSINGQLVMPKPSAAVCNVTTYNATACDTARLQWTNSAWRSDQVGASQNHNWENSSCSVFANLTACNQGSVPVYAVDATTPEHVQATIQFASKYHLRLVIKSTGHDYLGRSTAAGSLLLWLHHMTNMTLISQYSSCNMSNITNVVRVGAGVQWAELYRWLNDQGLVAVGATSGTVAAVGGFLQGGGHSPLSRWKGMGADQVLEYDVVTADGQRQTVSRCQNSDLFWALSGGGGGTYAVVLSAVLRTYPTPSMVVTMFNIGTTTQARFAQLLASFVELIPTLANSGGSAYFTIVDLSLSGILQWPNINASIADMALALFVTKNSDLDLTGTVRLSLPTFYSYYTTVLVPNTVTGANILLSSRLIPESVVLYEAEKVAEVFLQSKGRSDIGSRLSGHLVAGGQVSNTSNFNNSINPGWRTALLHMTYVQTWLDTASTSDQYYRVLETAWYGNNLERLAGNVSACYGNEAHPHESNWQEKFFGKGNYAKLKLIKKTVDPDGLFICKNCVGSDDWTEHLNCPKALSSRSIILTFSWRFILMIMVVYVI